MQTMTEEAIRRRLFAIRANKTAVDAAMGDDNTSRDRLFILADQYYKLDQEENDLRYFLNYGMPKGFFIPEVEE